MISGPVLFRCLRICLTCLKKIDNGVNLFTMKEKNSVKKNFVMNVILALSSVIFPLISFRYVSKILSPVGTGKVSFATSVISYYWIIACLGVPTYGIRAVAKVRDNKEELTRTVHELFFISMITTAIAYILLAISLAVVPRFQEDKILYVVISMEMLLYTVGVEWMYKGLEEYTFITMLSIVFKFIAVVLMLVMIKQPSDYIIYGGLTIFAACACDIVYFFNAHRYISMKPVGGYNLARHIRPVLIFFAMSCATTIYTHLDSVMLGFIAGDAEVGYYNAAVKIKYILVSVVTSLGAVLLPRASYYISTKRFDEFKRIGSKALNFVFVIAIPVIVYFTIFAKPGLLFISDTAYLPGLPAMRIIMPTVLFIGLTNILGLQMLVPLGKERFVLYSEIAGAVVDVIVNALAIPKYGAAGAAFGTLLAEAAVLLVQYISLRDMVKDSFKQISYLKIIAAVAAASLASFWVLNTSLGNFMTLLVSALIFFAVYLAILLLLKEELTTEIVLDIVNKVKARFGQSESGKE